jgi:type VI protein secretion system component VasF
MVAENKQPENKNKDTKKSILGFLSWKNKFDKSYGPELRQQWQEMDKIERRKFFFGVLVGLIIFIVSFVLLFILMANLLNN